MNRLAHAAGLLALAGSGVWLALVLPSADATPLTQTPLTITIAPPSTPVATTHAATTATTPKPAALGGASLLALLATGSATTLDARLRAPLQTALQTLPQLAPELSPIGGSPAAEVVVLLATASPGAYPVMSAVTPVVVRLATAAQADDPARKAGLLYVIERLARSAALLERGA